MIWYRKIMYWSIYILGFILIGVTSLMSSDLGWKGFNDWSFYIDTGLTYTAIICIIVATLLKCIDDFKLNDKEYKDSENDIKSFAANSYIPSIFSKFCDYTNKKRKLKQYIHDIKKKIYALESKASEKDLAIWVNNNKDERATNIYCQRRLLLEKQLTDEYIKTNIDTTKVVYDRISASIALGGYYEKDENNYANEFITKHKASKAALDNTPKLLFGFAVTCISTSIIISLSFSITMIIPILVKSITLLFQAFMTIRYAEEWNNTVTLKDIRFRRGITKEYNNWIKQEYARQLAEKSTVINNKSIADSIEYTNLPEELKTLQDNIVTKNMQEQQVIQENKLEEI